MNRDDTMPIEEKDLDEVVETKWKRVLDSMEEGKFYSINEMSEKIIGKRLFERDSFKEYLPSEDRKKKFVSQGTLTVAMSFYTSDIAYVWSFLATQTALGNLRGGRKDGMPYFCKT